MNNSWGCPVSEGCTTRGELETIVNNTQAAGIFVEVSAGNSGPGCSTVTDPPAIYEASFSTGAIDITNTLASFSSRGPSTFYTPNLLKPNISAPGVNVRSSLNGSDTSYANLSGTSMAGPHVVGVVALLWSARPQLVRDIATTKTILQNTANPAVIVSPARPAAAYLTPLFPTTPSVTGELMPWPLSTLSRQGDAYPHAFCLTNRYFNSNGYRYRYSHGNSNSYAYTDSNGYRHRTLRIHRQHGYCHRNSHGNSNSYAYTDSDGYRHSHGYRHRHRNGDSYCHCDGNCYRHSYRNADSHSQL